MKTTFDILDRIYPLINTTGVRATLDGGVYRNARPINSVKRDVVVLALPVSGGTDIDLQGCTIVVNCFAPDVATGIPDDPNLDAMTAQVLSAIETANETSEYLHLEITSQAMMEDMDNAGISYSSIRLDCTIEYGHVPESITLAGSSGTVFTATGSLGTP
jgi:hypothetical protein